MKSSKKRIKKSDDLRIVPLGGLGEVGRNMTLLEYKKEILVIDMGFRMPEENMPGVDYIIPNASYLNKKRGDILGVVFTHGHYDHIGAIPYLIDKLGNPPLYASGLAKGIILRRQEDFPNSKLNITRIKNGSKVKLGHFEIEFFRQNHNIADNFGLLIKTPIGNIVNTSDFKFDKNPVNDLPTDFEKLERIGRKRILLLMSDSTGAEETGHSLSEKQIFRNLEDIFKKADGRIIAATFGSLINRIQQIIKLSEKYNRKVAVDGYSMRTNVEICKNLGYLKSRKGTLISPREIKNYPDSEITLLCTGAQGEGSAVLMKVANREYPHLKIKGRDTVIFSSSVVPGNERTVQYLKDSLLRQGARVLHYKMMDIHAGGHAQREELRQMIRIMKPKFFLPIHGQYSMLAAHAQLARSSNISEKNIVVAENGQVIKLNKNQISLTKEAVPSNYVMVDGLGIGDVGEIVLRDRHSLSNGGMFVIIVVVDSQTGKVKGSPDIISRGFIYLKESKALLKETRKEVIKIVDKVTSPDKTINWIYVKDEIRNKIGAFLFKKTKRRPMILPVVIKV
jgi:ribonuclease J